MADTKISALVSGAPVTVVAGAIGFGVNDGGASKGLTLAQIKTFVNTAPIWAAGTATAGSWPAFTSGTLLTTPVSGTWEYDGTVIYSSSAAGRGVSPSIIWTRVVTGFNGVTGTALQKLFNGSTNGALTVPVGTYEFECAFDLTALSATSGTISFGFGGTAVATVRAQAVATKAGNPAAASAATLASMAATVITAAGTATTASASIMGTLIVTTAGTLIPSFACSVSTTPAISAGAFFKLTQFPAAATVGPWS